MTGEGDRQFARRLKALRIESGRDVPEVAAAMGLSPQSWYAYETGRSAFSYMLLPDVARALGMPMWRVLDRLYDGYEVREEPKDRARFRRTGSFSIEGRAPTVVDAVLAGAGA
jgi:transcriptional regulator with XRE-family HTH domain